MSGAGDAGGRGGDGGDDRDDTAIRVAFVCVENAGRSQMAAAFAERELAGRDLDGRIAVTSGGTEPADHVHDVVVEAMAEVGVDLADRMPQEITPAEIEVVDVVITMGCSAEDVCPATWRGDSRDWALDDPGSEGIDAVREIRDEIEGRVSALLDELEGRLAEGRPAFEADGGSPESDAGGSGSGLDPATQRTVVRERYGSIASSAGEVDAAGGAAGTESACCGGSTSYCGDGGDARARDLGYSTDELDAAPAGANLGLGCGNPNAIASLDPGEIVLDLGSGAGFDCFLAAREVGESGRVLGVDMTPEMVERARETARENDAPNVEFRLGEIEHLPVADATVEVVISNCAINLSPEKPRVFEEAHRVLRPGGRLAIADVVLTADLPDDVRADPASVAACVAGAATVDELEAMLDAAGFVDVDVAPKDDSGSFVREWDDERDLSEYVVSADITGRKPDADGR